MSGSVILHLSDVHRTPDEPATNAEILHSLKADLEGHARHGIPWPDVLVVSGDLSQAATRQEYDEAYALLSDLLDFLNLGSERLVLVPGNHDICWPSCRAGYVVPSGAMSEFQRELAFEQGTMALSFRDESAFFRRLEAFAEFYERMYGHAYPRARAEQYSVHKWPELGLAIAGLNSCDVNHEHNRVGRLHPSAVAAAAKELESFDGHRLAVWHHDLNWLPELGPSDCLERNSLLLASERVFELALCGHTHRPASANANSVQGRSLAVVAAGSLCAGPRQRPEGCARSYNVIRVQDRDARVWVRVKQHRNSPWRDHAVWGAETVRVGWYDANLRAADPPSQRPEEHGSSGPTGHEQVRFPRSAPFVDYNARVMLRERVVAEYVGTSAAHQIRADLPQIVLGARGSGKTALLLSMTANTPNDAGVRDYGLYCALRTGELSAFSGKGWMPKSERIILFRAYLGIRLAEEALRGLREYPDNPTDNDDATHRCLQGSWGRRIASNSIRECGFELSAARQGVVSALAELDDELRGRLREERLSAPLLRDPVQAMRDLAHHLDEQNRDSAVRWWFLFDEVEHLNLWQQGVLYEMMAHAGDSVTVKIATLPYAHTKALETLDIPLSGGDDYGEVALLSSTSVSDFDSIAQSLWASRLAELGIEAGPLDHVWPEEEYSIVANAAAPSLFADETLAGHLIKDLPPHRRESARQFLENDQRQWRQQFWSKYREPFRFRLARSAAGGEEIPLYWGKTQMLKACDDNPRAFLRLLDECWRTHWHAEGIRPLTAAEQFQCLRSWAQDFSRRVGTLPLRGQQLDSIVENVSRRLKAKLYGPRWLQNERLSVGIEDCSQEQAEAIAIGIAYGFLVPRVVNTARSTIEFPTENIELRLGYPVAVREQLPLRHGETLRIGTLRQLEFDWWED